MDLLQFAVEQVTPGSRFLDEMDKVVPWELLNTEMKKRIERKTGGRPAYSLELLLRMHLLQMWYGLSDAECEYQIRDRLSFRQFLKLTLTARIPDSTTLENFRHDLANTGMDHRLNEALDEFFKQQGLLLKEGHMVDATFIQANSRPHKDKTKNSDPEAEHGFKGFGYSATANVDVSTKLVRKAITTTERPHDSQNLEGVLVGDETLLYADSAYQGTQPMLKKRGCKARVNIKRKRGKKGEPTPELKPWAKVLNRLYSKVRSRVEHVFACFKTVFRSARARYRGLRKVDQQVQSLTLAYNLRRYGFLTRSHSVPVPNCA